MTDHARLRAEFEARLHRLREREHAIREDLRRTPDADSQERAISRENDEVLDRLDLQHSQEMEQLRSAIARIDAGKYGICTSCGGSIAPARLEALPFAATCVRCAT